MRVAVAQLDPVVGAFEANVKKIQNAYAHALKAGARLLLTPELGVCGYPPHDLLERPEMYERNEKALKDLQATTLGKSCALVVGHVARNLRPSGRHAQNQASVLDGGRVVFTQAKTLLPTYDVFDEARYFEPASEVNLWSFEGKRIALAICEDLWARDSLLGRRLYGVDPVESYRKADLVIALAASPYEWGKRSNREDIHLEVVERLGKPLIYVNQVGATDEILFDGGSFAAEPIETTQKGERGAQVVGRLPLFENSFGVFDLAARQWTEPDAKEREDSAPEEIEVLHRGLVRGIREYFQRTGFKKAILGLSGGIDSAVVACLAAQALGEKNVMGIGMPSQYSSAHSLSDAEDLARNLGISFEVRPIKFVFSTLSRELSERRGELHPIALENLQSRLRGIILMTLSNHYSALVLTTGNKSELATGYCTLYGDMVGALCPLGDVLKTRVYALARHINRGGGSPIPLSSIEKPPSAELKPDQVDQDTLPPYEILDAMLEAYIERHEPVSELRSRFEGKLKEPRYKNWVQETLRRLEINEYKRRQAAPVLKTTHKAFGIGRRIPIAKLWDQ